VKIRGLEKGKELAHIICAQTKYRETTKENDMNKKLFVRLLAAGILMSSTVAVFAQRPRGNDKDGAVYAMTNAAGDNQVVIFNRDAKGMLTLVGSVSTEGLGSGGGLDPLASQGALVLSQDHRWLLAVNAGSNEISAFRVKPDGLELVDKVDSGGDFPVSLAIFQDLVYILNAGGMSPNITGLALDHRGRLIRLNDSTRSLGTGAFSQVGFDPRGQNLVITDRDENEILVFSVDRRGLPSMEPVTSMSNGIAPFAFIFDELGHLLVAEAGSGAVSSYDILRDDSLRVISPSVANNQTATCWISGRMPGYVFTANTGSQTISAYSLQARENGKGKLVLLDETAGSGNRPIDMDISDNGRFLYALDPGSETIDIFAIGADGSLSNLGTMPGGLSIFAQGIAVR
jgi:6-phosphogluconolactonase